MVKHGYQFFGASTAYLYFCRVVFCNHGFCVWHIIGGRTLHGSRPASRIYRNHYRDLHFFGYTIDVSWNDNNDNFYYTDLIIATNSDDDHLMEIVSKTNQKELFIEKIDKKNTDKGINYILNVKIKTVTDLDNYMNDLSSLNYVKNVERIHK